MCLLLLAHCCAASHADAAECRRRYLRHVTGMIKVGGMAGHGRAGQGMAGRLRPSGCRPALGAPWLLRLAPPPFLSCLLLTPLAEHVLCCLTCISPPLPTPLPAPLCPSLPPSLPLPAPLPAPAYPPPCPSLPLPAAATPPPPPPGAPLLPVVPHGSRPGGTPALCGLPGHRCGSLFRTVRGERGWGAVCAVSRQQRPGRAGTGLACGLQAALCWLPLLGCWQSGLGAAGCCQSLSCGS